MSGATWIGCARKERDTFAAFPGSWALIQGSFEPIVADVIAAAQGDRIVRAQVEGLFDQFRAGKWQIVDAIQRIWQGERNLDVLTEVVEPRNSALIIRKVLERLGSGNREQNH